MVILNNKLVTEYKNQSIWREWDSYIDELNILPNQKILDIGCGTGDVTKLLAEKAFNVIAIDFNKELLEFAKKENSSPNIDYIQNDIRNIDELSLSKVDGIWSSFTPAYFVDFKSILQKWLNLLKPNGWIALIEIDDLFGHKPIDEFIEKLFKTFYKNQKDSKIYDFEMGRKLKQFLIDENIEIEFEKNKFDKELVFSGIADIEIVNAWAQRFERMKSLQIFFGNEFHNVKKQFLNTLSLSTHYSESKIFYIKGRKLYL